MDLQRKADSYLEHILIAARVGDRSSGLWRNMVDNWNCYSRGDPFVTLQGRGGPRWFNKATALKHGQALRLMHRRSVEADAVMARFPTEPLAVDHAVPVNVLRDMAIEQVSAWECPEDVRAFLAKWYRLCVITQAEHGRLSSAKFHRARSHHDRIFDRYTKAGIELLPA